MLGLIFLLLVVFQFKHFIADYILQGEYMLGKFKDRGWIKPLLSHVIVHGVLTGLICLIFCPKIMLVMMLLDMVCHFAMDRIKASGKLLGRFKPITAERMIQILKFKQEFKYVEPEMKLALDSNRMFWWSLGIDQMVHHLTHYVIIVFILIFRS